jgi:transcriptional regulator with XRE-family HTH domain
MSNFFSENLIFLRKIKDLNQSETAIALSLKRNTISNYETGHSEPNIDNILKIASFFNINAQELLNVDLSKSRFEQKKGSDKLGSKVEVSVEDLVEVQPKPAENNVLAQPPPDIVALLKGRLADKESIIRAKEAQIAALELAVSLLQQRLQAFEQPMQKTG